jgi:hypothetical protein
MLEKGRGARPSLPPGDVHVDYCIPFPSGVLVGFVLLAVIIRDVAREHRSWRSPQSNP